MKTTDRCFDLMVRYADEYKPHKYNTKFSNTYYLTHITNVLPQAGHHIIQHTYRTVCMLRIEVDSLNQ